MKASVKVSNPNSPKSTRPWLSTCQHEQRRVCVLRARIASRCQDKALFVPVEDVDAVGQTV